MSSCHTHAHCGCCWLNCHCILVLRFSRAQPLFFRVLAATACCCVSFFFFNLILASSSDLEYDIAFIKRFCCLYYLVYHCIVRQHLIDCFLNMRAHTVSIQSFWIIRPEMPICKYARRRERERESASSKCLETKMCNCCWSWAIN